MHTLDTGTVFANRFEIESKAGSGGMGTVYRARDRFTGEPVALKLIEAAGPSLEAERFIREAKLLSELVHPRIVSHISHGQSADGQLFLAMQWLEGQDLSQRLRDGPLSIRDTVSLIHWAADALAFAHEKGIVHRDLKPSNLFLQDGEIDKVILLDFGIARRTVSWEALTRTGVVLGTPGFMAPEQIRSDSKIGPATDVFALGCLAYLCLTSHLPFTAEEPAAILVKVLFDSPAPLSSLHPSIPTALEDLIHRMLAKDPEQRPADGGKVRDVLAVIASEGLSNDRLAPTVSGKIVSDKEQFLYSIIVARLTAPGRHSAATAMQPSEVFDEDLDPTSSIPANLLELEQYHTLLSALRNLGAQPSILPNGWLLVSLLTTSSATDQAAQAAQAALLIKESCPRIDVALCTGRGFVEGLTPSGDVVQRAMQILSRNESTTEVMVPGIFLDTLSAGLLAPRFTVTMVGELAVLIKEQREVDASRPLLGKPTPCVGRETELSTMEAQLTGCIEESEARALLVTAAPGVGKSRLRHEFLRRIEQRKEIPAILLGRGERTSAGTPYGILSQAVRRLCGITGGEPLETQQQILRERIGRHLSATDAERVVVFLGELSSIPFSDKENPMLQMARQNPKGMQDRIRQAFQDFVAAECAIKPMLLVFDDLHWGDELTVSLIDKTLRELSNTPLCVVALARPEVHELFPKLWQGRKLQEIPLKGLSKKACERLIQQVLGKQVAGEVMARIIEQSTGNALFLEELIRATAEGKSADQIETVLAMLQGRIGRFEAGPRRVLRAASVFGQTFWSGGVAEILGVSEKTQDLDAALVSLIDAEAVEAHPASQMVGEKQYGFRHALVRDAAYALLTEEDRQLAHQVAGSYLERLGVDNPIVLAEHAHGGNQMQRASAFYLKAAQQASDNINLKDAYKLAEQAVGCIGSGEPLGAARCIQAWVLMWQNQFPRADALAAEALACLPSGTRLWLKSLAIPLFVSLLTGRYERTVPLIEQLIDYSPTEESYRDYVDTVRMVFAILCQRLGTKVAERLLRRIEQVCPESFVPYLQNIYYEFYRHSDVYPWRQVEWAEGARQVHLQSGLSREGMLAHSYVGEAYGEIGELARGEAILRASAATFERQSEPYGRSHALMHLAGLLSNRIDDQAVSEVLALCQELLQRSDLTKGFVGWCHAMLARVYLLRRELVQAEQHARQAIDALHQVPFRRLTASAMLVNVLLEQDRTAEAYKTATEILVSIAALGKAGYAEMPARAAASMAYHCAGESQQAHEILRAGLRELRRRASLAPDAKARQLFLTQVPDNVRIQELARAWLGAEAIADMI